VPGRVLREAGLGILCRMGLVVVLVLQKPGGWRGLLRGGCWLGSGTPQQHSTASEPGQT